MVNWVIMRRNKVLRKLFELLTYYGKYGFGYDRNLRKLHKVTYLICIRILWNGDEHTLLMVGTRFGGAAAPNNGGQVPAGQFLNF